MNLDLGKRDGGLASKVTMIIESIHAIQSVNVSSPGDGSSDDLFL